MATRIILNSAGMAQMLRSAPVAAEMARRARNVAAAAQRARVDPSALWRKFLREVWLPVLPTLVFAGVALAAVAADVPLLAALGLPAAAVAWLVLIPIVYPFSPPQDTDVVSLMGDVAASPVVGRPVHLAGEVIGRADAGSVIGEDTIFADPTGRMVVDFRSLLGPIGDMWTGWRRVARHIGQKGEVVGWFRRGMGGHVIMRELTTTAGKLRAYPYLAGAATLFILFAVVVTVSAITGLIQSL